MNGKILPLRLYTIFFILVFFCVIIIDFSNPECSSTPEQKRTMILFCVIALVFCLIFLIFPKKWEIFSFLHVFLAIALTVQTMFPLNPIVSALLFTEALVVAFVHGFFNIKLKRKISVSILVLFAIPLFGPTFTLKRIILAELINIYVLGITFFSFCLLRNFFLEQIIKERHILLSNKQVLDLQSLNLSEREICFINLLIKGITYKEISCTFSMSESSVKKYMGDLFAKFGVSSREGFLSYISQFDLSFPSRNNKSEHLETNEHLPIRP